MSQRYFSFVLILGLVFQLMASPVLGEGFTIEEDSTPQENPLPPPPDFAGKTGDGPGFRSEPDDELNNPSASNLGQIISEATYGIAGLLALYSMYKLKPSVERSQKALLNLVSHSPLREQYIALRKKVEANKEQKEKLQKELEDSVKRYESSLKGLQDHLESGGKNVEAQKQEKALTQHMEALLNLPLAKRRKSLKEELRSLINPWKNSKDSTPLNEWLDKNRSYDLIRTAKGQEWLAKYIDLQRELARAQAMENGDHSQLRIWKERYGQDPLIGESGKKWLAEYDRLTTLETLASHRMLQEFGNAFRRISGEEALPVRPLGAGGSFRSPGQFVLNTQDGTVYMDSSQALQHAQQTCDALHGQLSGLARTARSAQSIPGNLWRMSWPLLPYAGISAGGTYLVIERLNKKD